MDSNGKKLGPVTASPDLKLLAITREQAAEMVGLCPRTIDALIKRGELGAFREGRAVRIPVRELRRLVNTKTSRSPVNKKAADATGGEGKDREHEKYTAASR